MKVRFSCPECAARVRGHVTDGPLKCPGCGFASSATPEAGARLGGCLVCGNHELYARKAFPSWLGMTIVVLASAGFLFFHATYRFYAAWGCLVGAFGLDVLLYFLMGSVTVCYRCQAEHAGFDSDPPAPAFELATAERYRQERLRRQQMGPLP